MITLRRLGIATALALTATAAPSIPVGAATTPVSGTFVFDDTDATCPDPPDGLRATNTFIISGDLEGCWYTNVDRAWDLGPPSGLYFEVGREVFVGTVREAPTGPSRRPTRSNPNGTPTIATGTEIWGRCQHLIVRGSGTGGLRGCHRFPRPHRHRHRRQQRPLSRLRPPAVTTTSRRRTLSRRSSDGCRRRTGPRGPATCPSCCRRRARHDGDLLGAATAPLTSVVPRCSRPVAGPAQRSSASGSLRRRWSSRSRRTRTGSARRGRDRTRSRRRPAVVRSCERCRGCGSPGTEGPGTCVWRRRRP